jgi:hypothetical protein
MVLAVSVESGQMPAISDSICAAEKNKAIDARAAMALSRSEITNRSFFLLGFFLCSFLLCRFFLRFLLCHFYTSV